MKITAIVLGLVLVAFGLAGWSSPTPRPGELVVANNDLIIREPDSAAPTAGVQGTRFRVTNVGGTPVRFTGLESSCGCTTPRAEPAVIDPGKSGSVEVTIRSIPVGQRAVTILAHTDSPIQPDLTLRATAIGSRKPPFLLRVAGELAFRGPFSAQTPREFEVNLVAKAGDQENPVIEVRLPDAIVEGPTSITEQVYLDPGTILRSFRYQFRWKTEPATSPIAAELLVRDPWSRSTTMRLPIHWEIPPELAAIPARLLIRAADSTTGGCRGTVQLHAMTPTPDLTVEPEPAAAASIKVHRLTASADQREFTYEVVCSPTSADQRALSARLIARLSPEADRRLIIPVLARFQGATP